MRAIHNLQSRGPTTQSWVQNYNMVPLVKQFLQAERMGNLQLHLDTIKKMIPFFHAAGHYPYAKSGHWYLQEMSSKHVLFGGQNESDRVSKIHQSKIFDNRNRNSWDILKLEVTWRVEKEWQTVYCWSLRNISLQDIVQWSNTLNLQHYSGITRDEQYVERLEEWFSKHPPFSEAEEIMSTRSNVVESEQVNCY